MRVLNAIRVWLLHLWQRASRPVDDEEYEEHLESLPPC